MAILHCLLIAQVLGWPDLGKVESPFPVVQLQTDEATARCKIPSAIQRSLVANGFVKAVCPFGVLLAATSTYPDKGARYGAAVIANMLDQDQDGQADDAAVVASLTYLNDNRGAMMACGVSRAEEEKEEFVEGFDYTFSCQTHYVAIAAADNTDALSEF